LLPLSKPATWFVQCLNISVHSKIVILDDDISIHHIWDDRFENLKAKDFDIELLHFSIPDQLIHWAKKNEEKLSQILFLIDYELIGFSQVDLDVIEDLGIQSQSILVTSHYEEEGLRARCERLGVKLILKGMAGFVPIRIEPEPKVDAILIDDDSLVHTCWQISAKIKKKALAVFSTPEDFMSVSDTFAKCIPIYVDVSLLNGVRGEDVAKKLSEIGFYNIYLATGYEASSFKSLSFIKGVIGKAPPF